MPTSSQQPSTTAAATAAPMSIARTGGMCLFFDAGGGFLEPQVATAGSGAVRPTT